MVRYSQGINDANELISHLTIQLGSLVPKVLSISLSDVSQLQQSGILVQDINSKDFSKLSKDLLVILALRLVDLGSEFTINKVLNE